MATPRPILCSLLLFAILSLASSCVPPPPPPKPEESKTGGTLSQAKAYLSSGNYKKALDLYGAAFDKHPDSEDLLDTYTEVLESVKEAADKYYDARDYPKAGELYATLLNSGFTERPLQGELSFDDDYLTMRIGASSKMLIELGIMKYRTGDLQQAITIWKKILVFNPSDREAKAAIDRATAQLQNLKQIK
jgi:tetratricopeptide (TPR) repeat protein